MRRSNVDAPTRDVLDAHHVAVSGDRPWQRRLRLLQSIWREEQGLPPGAHPRGADDGQPLGSRLALPEAERHLSNYLTDTIKQVAREELDSTGTRADGKLFSKPRIYDDLLSSQPLCFNLFGELKADLDLATALGRHLWPARVDRVTRMEFEHSPGRGDETYLGNRTAFDVYLEHTTLDGGEGFVGIEVKYHESLEVSAAGNRERIHQVARESGIFAAASLAELSSPPLQQVWFDHLLALSILQADADRWAGSGLFVFLHPVANVASYRVVDRYERLLLDRSTFQRLTLEEVVAALLLVDGRPWVDAFRHRYLAYQRTAGA
jgi:hypothetical protein